MGATTTPHIVHCPLSKIKKKKGSKGMQFPCKIVKVFTLLRILRLLQHSTSVRCVLLPCLICAHEQLEPSQKNGGGCDCVQIIGLAVMQDKEAVHFGCNSLHNIDKKRCTR
jgi:hypothetical protein